MRIATAACLAAICALFAQGAKAQDATTADTSADVTTSGDPATTTEVEAAAEAQAASAAPATAEQAVEPEPEEDDEEAMNSFGFGLKVGGGMILGQTITAASTTTGGTVTRRENDAGLAIGIPLYFGDGHGFGADLELFHWRQKESGFRLNYTGLQAAFGARFQLSNPVYMFIGLGPRFGVVHGDVDVGVHAALRLPVQVTWYPIKMLGIVGEVGLGYGGTARSRFNQNNFADTSAEFVSGFLLDFTVGVRFP